VAGNGRLRTLLRVAKRLVRSRTCRPRRCLFITHLHSCSFMYARGSRSGTVHPCLLAFHPSTVAAQHRNGSGLPSDSKHEGSFGMWGRAIHRTVSVWVSSTSHPRLIHFSSTTLAQCRWNSPPRRGTCITYFIAKSLTDSRVLLRDTTKQHALLSIQHCWGISGMRFLVVRNLFNLTAT
jgi:hypothetical protein